MADYPFLNGAKGYVSLIVNAHQYDIPALIGTGISAPTNDRLLTAGQGPDATYGASNKVSGIKTPTLAVSAAAMESFFTDTFVADLLLTRTAQFDLSPIDIKYSTGADTATDIGKLRSLQLTIDRGSNFVGLDMTFLTRNVASAATFTAYSHPFGDVASACKSVLKYTDDAATVHGGTIFAPYGVFAERISFGTGAFGQKHTGGTETCDQLTNIAAAALRGGVTVSQQAGAADRLDASASGIFEWNFFNGSAGTWFLRCGVNRADKGLPLNPEGSADVTTAWEMYAGGNASNILVTATAT
jgi:hypothetical protein